jgi:hypothetical protein
LTGRSKSVIVQCNRIVKNTRGVLTSKTLLQLLNKEAGEMVISYKKLWKLLIDKDLKKVDLKEKACLSSSLTYMYLSFILVPPFSKNSAELEKVPPPGPLSIYLID